MGLFVLSFVVVSLAGYRGPDPADTELRRIRLAPLSPPPPLHLLPPAALITAPFSPAPHPALTPHRVTFPGALPQSVTAESRRLPVAEQPPLSLCHRHVIRTRDTCCSISLVQFSSVVLLNVLGCRLTY